MSGPLFGDNNADMGPDLPETFNACVRAFNANPPTSDGADLVRSDLVRPSTAPGYLTLNLQQQPNQPNYYVSQSSESHVPCGPMETISEEVTSVPSYRDSSIPLGPDRSNLT